jgi:Domain of unknown function (DUF5666)
MKRITYAMIGVVVFTLLAAGLTDAADNDMVRIRGVVMSVNLKKGEVVVNERRCKLDNGTVIQDQNGLPTTLEKIKEHDWVYLEGRRDQAGKKVVAKRIQCLPRGAEGKGGSLAGR